MATMNRCEAEVDAIRDKLFEKYKNMTPEEHTQHVNEQAKNLAAQYGFKIGKPLNQQGKKDRGTMAGIRRVLLS